MASSSRRGRLAAATMLAALFVLPGPSVGAEDGRGEALFELCAQCHGPAGGGMQLALAPAIAGLDQWYVEAQLNLFKSGARGTHPQDIPGMRMHPMSRWLRTPEDVTAVSQYVASMPPVKQSPTLEGGDVERGEGYWATCTACHGPEGMGMQPLNAPKLAGSSDWYLYSTLLRYKSGARGGNPANTNAVMMRGMANVLPDEQAVRDVVAYIMTLPQ